MNTPLLSTRLSRSVSSDFFRPLARPSVPVYVDCADRLIEEAGESGRLTHKEVIEIIREVLTLHPEALLQDDEGAALRDSRQRAGQFFNRLLGAGWLEDQTLGLHERWAVITPGLRPLMRMLRDLAEDQVAELKTFADTLRGLCETLERQGILVRHYNKPGLDNCIRIGQHFTGCLMHPAGSPAVFQITAVRVTIAGHACILLLNRPVSQSTHWE